MKKYKEFLNEQVMDFDFVKWIGKNNYKLVDLQNLYYNNKNQIIQFDMLYINKKFSQQRG